MAKPKKLFDILCKPQFSYRTYNIIEGTYILIISSACIIHDTRCGFSYASIHIEL